MRSLVIISNENSPFVSVIIATRNEEKYLKKLLDSIVTQTYPQDRFEVLIVDGMSTDRTVSIVNEYKSALNLRVLFNNKVRAPSAFNIGIDESKGSLFVIIGAHSFLSEDFLQQSVDTYLRVKKEEPMLVAVGGCCIDEYLTRAGKLASLLYRTPLSGARSCRFKREAHYSDSVIFGLFEKEIVIKNGKFDEDFLAAGDDDDLTIRLHSRGYKFFTNPEIGSHYYNRNSLAKFLKQTFNYGVAKGLMVRKGVHKLEFSNTASLWFFPSAFLFYELLLLTVLLSLGLSFAFMLAIIPFIVYWAAGIAFSIIVFKDTKSPLCMLLPPLYFIFHNVLGMSSILGLALKNKAFL